MSDLEQRMLGITKSMFNRLLVRADAARVRQSSERNDLALAGRHPSELVGWTVECEDEVRATLSAYRSALAGEDFDTSLKAFADKVCESFVALGPRFTGGNLAPSVALLADVVSVAKEHAWRLRAPLLVQLQELREASQPCSDCVYCSVHRQRGDTVV